MLRVAVGLSRKLSHDYNSAWVSVTLEGELSNSLADPDSLLEEIRILHDEEAVADRLVVMGYDHESGWPSCTAPTPDDGPPAPGGPATRRGRDRAPHVGGRGSVTVNGEARTSLSRNGRADPHRTNGRAASRGETDGNNGGG